MRNILIILLVASLLPVNAQELRMKNSRAGILSLGVRASYGLVNDGKWQRPAFGSGAQFRLQFSDRVNTEWFLDHLTADLSDFGWRADTHIGWSVMYYLTKNPLPKVQPYLLAGHCFEYLRFTDNASSANFAERWSASVQAGVGTHFKITKRFDISATAQYMVHFGTKIFASHDNDVTTFAVKKGAGIHDHILLHISLNYKIADLW
jgi:hypothetical protein